MNAPSLDLTSHSYVSQRLRLHYVDWGNSEAPPLILVHGGRDHCRNWDWVAERLRADFHILAPDLRGHGDSQWSPDGSYSLAAHVYDLAQLIHQQDLAPVTLVAHSLGGNIAARYAGTYPDNVAALVVIEGLGLPPPVEAARGAKPIEQRMREWIDQQRALSGRQARRYASVEQALLRMQEENRHLTPAQARHLTLHGVMQNEDGTYSWKFDNYIRTLSPVDLTHGELTRLWSQISCPTLLVYGSESWASDPGADGRLEYFQNARVARFEGAGHWVQHDQLGPFVAEVRRFLGASA